MASEEEENGCDTSSACMICMEEFTLGSEHRICCLKCGHLFGRSCIERWIKEKGSHAKCPNCNKPTKKVDIRDIWCKAIKASDDSEFRELKKALENERKLRRTDAATLFQNNLRIEVLHEELDRLKHIIIDRDQKILKLERLIDNINKCRAQKMAATDGGESNELPDIMHLDPEQLQMDINVNVQPKELKGMFHPTEEVISSSIGGCKSLALCPVSSVILVAQPGQTGATGVFGKFGLKKFSTLASKLQEFIPLHSKTITSIQLKPFGDLILTTSQDKKIKLTSIHNNTCVQSYSSQFDPTCVSWSIHRDQQFYVGFGNCYVSLYDIRNTSECIYQTSRKVANTRLLSIASTTGEDSIDGLLVNDTKGCHFLEVSSSSSYESQEINRTLEHLTPSELPFEGLMGTVDFHKATGIALITTRRSTASSNCAHNLVKLKKAVDEENEGQTKVSCESVKTFYGGRAPDLLSHSRILRHPTVGDSILVGACDDTARGIKLWDASDGTDYQTIRTNVFVRDMIMYTPENTNVHVLYALSEKGLGIYRWDYA